MSNRLTIEEFIKKSQKKYGEQFDYSKVVYKNSHTKIHLICTKKDENGNIHGDFWISPLNHMQGNGGCHVCKSKRISELKCKTNEEFINQALKVHNKKYSYDKSVYINNWTKTTVTCPEHGDFLVTPNQHLRGVGCAKCYGNYQSNTEEFIEKAKKVHNNDYSYDKVNYINNKTKVIIKCNRCGEEFLQTPHGHLKGLGCYKCGRMKAAEHLYDTNEEYIAKARKIHGDKYDYSLLKKERYIQIICPKHGVFMQHRLYHLDGCGCQKCALAESKSESEIEEFLIGYNIETKKRDKKTIKPFEIDILLPERKIGIEFDGLHWHSEKYRGDKLYHIKKTNMCNDNGIKLIHIFEDEWYYKKEIVKSILRKILNVGVDKLFASKCEVSKISKKEANIFLDINHIDGKCNSNENYGLYYNSELVSVMSFKRKLLSKSNRTDDTWEICRSCDKLNLEVIGSYRKIINYFVTVNKPKKIIAYNDIRWGHNGCYEEIGFSYVCDTKPDFSYVIGDRRIKKYNFKKKKLADSNGQSSKTLKAILKEKKIYRIYDCGKMKYEILL